MSLNALKQRYEEGGEVETEREATTPVVPATPSTPKKAQSALAQQVGYLASNPQVAQEREDRVRAYYDKKLADLQRREGSLGNQWGIDEVLANFGAADAETQALRSKNYQAGLARNEADRKEVMTGLNELDMLKAQTASRSNFNNLMQQAFGLEASGDKAGAEKLRRQALLSDPTQFDVVTGGLKTEKEIEKLDSEIIKNLNTSQTKGQLTDMQKITAGEKYRELNEQITQTKSDIAQGEAYSKNLSKLIDHKGLQRATGSVFGLLPSFSKESKDFDNLLGTVQSQVFLNNVTAMKGMGALSNAEGEKIAQAQAALKTTLSPEEMKRQLRIIQETYDRGIKKQKEILATRQTSARGYQEILTKAGVEVPPIPQAEPSAPKEEPKSPIPPSTPRGGAGSQSPRTLAAQKSTKSNQTFELPPEAVKQLKEGHQTTFNNGQIWTLQGGKPVKVA